MGNFISNTFVKIGNQRQVADILRKTARPVTPVDLTDEAQAMWASITDKVDKTMADALWAVKMASFQKPFFLSPSLEDWVGIYREEWDEIGDFAQQLSNELNTEAISFLVYDSDYLRYFLYSKGALLDSYQSSAEPDEELAGKPKVLASVFGCESRIEELTALLTDTDQSGDVMLAALSDILGLNNTHMSYDYFLNGETDDVEAWESFLKFDGSSLRQVARKLKVEPANEETSSLHDAARRGDVKALRELIANGADVNQATKDGPTALMLASMEGHIGAVGVLLQTKAKVNAKARAELDYSEKLTVREFGRGKTRVTAIHLACMYGHEDVVSLLQEFKADPWISNSYLDDGLMLAVRNGHSRIVRALLRQAIVYGMGRPASLAIRYGHIEVLNVLMQYGAELDAFDLAHAVGGPPHMLEYLLSLGIRDDERLDALRQAARDGDWNAFQLLLQHAPEPTISDRRLFCSACMGGNMTIVNYLLEQGITPETWGSAYELFSYAMWHPAVLRRLLELGFEPDDRDDGKVTPLMKAASTANLKAAKILIEFGADVNARDSSDQTPLHHCIGENTSPSIARLLLKHGADPTKKCQPWFDGDEERDFFQLARAFPHKGMLRLLEEIEREQHSR